MQESKLWNVYVYVKFISQSNLFCLLFLEKQQTDTNRARWESEWIAKQKLNLKNVSKKTKQTFDIKRKWERKAKKTKVCNKMKIKESIESDNQTDEAK